MLTGVTNGYDLSPESMFYFFMNCYIILLEKYLTENQNVIKCNK